MEGSIFSYIIYGLISGFSEFLPVSALAHQYVFSYVTGFEVTTPYLPMMIYLGCLASVFFSCRKRLVHIRRELRIDSLPKHRKKRVADMQAVLEYKLMLIGLVPIIVSILCSRICMSFFSRLTLLCLTLVASGCVVYFSQFFVSANCDSKNMRRVDGLMLGVCTGLSVIPGLSWIGLFMYIGQSRGCSRSYIYDWALLFSIPMFLGLFLFQLIAWLVAGVTALSQAVIIAGILAALAAFGGGLASIRLMRFLAVKAGTHGFALYTWGLAVFCFIFYLMT